MRYSLLILLLTSVTFRLSSQEYILRDSLGSALYGIGAPALLSQASCTEGWGKAEVSKDNFSFLTDPRLSLPRNSHEVALTTEGLKRFGATTVWGRVEYQHTKMTGIKGNITADSELFYPYIFADTKEHTFRSEVYRLFFEAAHRFSQFCSIGLGGWYSGTSDYTRQDPRASHTTSNLGITTGIECSPGKFGSLSTHIGYSRYIQDLGYSVLVPDASEMVYMMRPYGQYNHRYSKRNESASYRYYLSGFTASLSHVHLPRQSMVMLEMARTQAKLGMDKVGMYPSEIKGLSLLIRGASQICPITPNDILFLDVSLLFRERDATENVYNMVPIDGFSSLTQPELISSDRTFKEFTTSAMMTPRFRHTSPLLMYDIGAKVSWFQYLSHSMQSDDQATLSTLHAGPDLRIRFSPPTLGCTLETALTWEWSLLLRDSISLRESEVRNIELSRHMYRGDRGARTHVSQSILIPTGRDTAVKMNVGFESVRGYRRHLTASLSFYY